MHEDILASNEIPKLNILYEPLLTIMEEKEEVEKKEK